MSSPQAWALLLVPLLGWAVAPLRAQRATAGSVSGAFVDTAARRPVPGALVGLYEKGTGYLVDSTYTREDGRFDLHPPGHKGDFFLVITQDGASARADLAGYDPAGPAIYREVFRHKPGPGLWSRALDYGRTKLELLAAFLLGLLVKWFQEQGKASRTLVRRTTELRRLVLQAERTFQEELPPLPSPVDDAQYRQILTHLQPRLAEIQAELAKGAIEDTLFELHGSAGANEHADFRNRLEEIAGLVQSRAQVGFGQAAARLAKLSGLLAELAGHPLLHERASWWRKIGSIF